jgi:hypothetical protein
MIIYYPLKWFLKIRDNELNSIKDMILEFGKSITDDNYGTFKGEQSLNKLEILIGIDDESNLHIYECNNHERTDSYV